MTLTHLDEHGHARMVDVSAKPATPRTAVARSVVRMKPETLEAVRSGGLEKGDALAVARVAGILAAKRVPELIPLCHSLPLAEAGIEFEYGEDRLIILATAATIAQTGVEMEALTAASIAALTIYDMVKGIDKAVTIHETCLLRKTGGRSGDYQREETV